MSFQIHSFVFTACKAHGRAEQSTWTLPQTDGDVHYGKDKLLDLLFDTTGPIRAPC